MLYLHHQTGPLEYFSLFKLTSLSHDTRDISIVRLVTWTRPGSFSGLVCWHWWGGFHCRPHLPGTRQYICTCHFYMFYYIPNEMKVIFLCTFIIVQWCANKGSSNPDRSKLHLYFLESRSEFKWLELNPYSSPTGNRRLQWEAWQACFTPSGAIS